MKGLSSSLFNFLHRKDSVVTQIVKYVFCGGISVVVDQAVFYVLALSVFPCLRLSDPVFRLLGTLGLSLQAAGEDELKRNFWIIKGICFVLSNGVVYLLNARYVFRTGRHRKMVEIFLFFGSSLFQFFFIWLGGILITVLKWEVTYSNIVMLTVGITINYIVRKKIVFKG
jgi:putative flippase GtrA